MIVLTPAAVGELKRLVGEHPEDPVVRLALQDLDEQRFALSITLEPDARPDDETQDCDGLLVAIEARSAQRLDGVALDYTVAEGFRLRHPAQDDGDLLGGLSLN